MDVEKYSNYCQTKPFTTLEYSFGPTTPLFKVKAKMFGLIALDADPPQMNLKCDPEDALALRKQYPAIIKGYHMSAKHWNTLIFDGSLPDSLVYELIDHSYDLVVAGLKVKDREAVWLAMGRL